MTPHDKHAPIRAALDALSAETEGRNGIPWFDPRQVLREEVTGEFDRELPQIPETDMAYIAAANPEAIRALLAERDALADDAKEQARLNGMGSEREARLIAERYALREALQAAVDCGMVPKSSASEGGANLYSEQVRVADQIRAALAQEK